MSTTAPMPCVLIMKSYSDDEHINVGSGEDRDDPRAGADRLRGRRLYGHDRRTICTKPDGTPRKLMSGAKLAAMGWRPTISLQEGLAAAYRSFLAEQTAGR